MLATLGRRQIRTYHLCLATLSLKFVLEVLASSGVAIHRDRDGSFLSTGFADCLTYPLGSARYQYDFVLDLKVHSQRAVYDGDLLRKPSREGSENLHRSDNRNL